MINREGKVNKIMVVKSTTEAKVIYLSMNLDGEYYWTDDISDGLTFNTEDMVRNRLSVLKTLNFNLNGARLLWISAKFSIKDLPEV